MPSTSAAGGPLRSPPRPSAAAQGNSVHHGSSSTAGPIPSYSARYGFSAAAVPLAATHRGSAASTPLGASDAIMVNRSTQPSNRASPERPKSPQTLHHHSAAQPSGLDAPMQFHPHPMWATAYPGAAHYGVPPVPLYTAIPPYYAPSAVAASRAASPVKSLPAAAVNADLTAVTPVVDAVVDAEITARFEAKDKEIASLTRSSATLKTALKQTKEAFEANTTQLRECQELCHRLEQDVFEREVRLRDLEAYKRDTAERLDNVDTLVRREKEHAMAMADDLRRQLEMATAERSAMQARLLASQEETDKARHEIQHVKREHARDLQLAAHEARLNAESEAEEKLRLARAKMDEKEGSARHVSNDMISLRGELQREHDRAEAWKARVDGLQSELIDTQHKLQQAVLRNDELTQLRETDVAHLRRENESLRVARDELSRAGTSQMLQLTQESTKRGHEVETLSQQVHALKLQMEAEQRRHRSELDDAVRNAEVKLRGAAEDARQFERQLRATEDQCERLRKQLGDERAGRDFTDGERDALQDKIVALQRAVAKRDTEIQRLHSRLEEANHDIATKAKEAEAVGCELSVREAREKRELTIALDSRLKEFRSVTRMRHQASIVGPDLSDTAVLAERFNEMSVAQTLARRAGGGGGRSQYDESYDDYEELPSMVRGEGANTNQSTAGVPTPGRAPRATMNTPQQRRPSASAHSGTPIPPPLAPQPSAPVPDAFTYSNPNVAAYEATNAAMMSMQRLMERQLAIERERSDTLSRKLTEVSISSLAAQQGARTAALEEGLNETRASVEAIVSRQPARGAAMRGTASTKRATFTDVAEDAFGVDSASSGADRAVAAGVPPSPRAERLRAISESLKHIPMPSTRNLASPQQ